jgi:cation diffusion facilitator CzcD-associated flavoprotein CzcO
MYSHCIIGAGVTGLLLLLILNERGIPLESIVIVDPFFDGGDLRRKWGQVISNTPWSKTYDAVKTAFPSRTMPAWASAIPPEQTTPLSQIARLVCELSRPLLLNTVYGSVKRASYNEKWSVEIQREFTIHKIESTKIFFTTGSEQKSLDLSIPSIPLEIALDSQRLRQYVLPTDKVILFGTAHSGALILKNLAEMGVSTTAVYRSAKAFMYARDGEYDGIKADAATYADEISQGIYPCITLVQASAISKVIRLTRSANWAVYAIGFEPRCTIEIQVGGSLVSVVPYLSTSGVIVGCPNAWGFGIAYPSQAPDGIHFDVGVASFIEHISNNIGV